MSDALRVTLIALCIFLLVASFFGLAAQETRKPRRKRRVVEPAPARRSGFEELLERDPLAALAEYGTPDDAERLIETGVDLAASGYRPSDRP